MRHLFLLAWGLLAAAQDIPETRDRYLYVITCDGRVDKVDTLNGETSFSAQLAERTGKQTLDSRCGRHAQWLFNLTARPMTPKNLSCTRSLRSPRMPLPDGTRDYRALSFSVPGLELINSRPAAEHAALPPRLVLGQGEIKIVPEAEWTPPVFRPGTQVLAQSGPVFLLRVFCRRSRAIDFGDRR